MRSASASALARSTRVRRSASASSCFCWICFSFKARTCFMASDSARAAMTRWAAEASASCTRRAFCASAISRVSSTSLALRLSVTSRRSVDWTSLTIARRPFSSTRTRWLPQNIHAAC